MNCEINNCNYTGVIWFNDLRVCYFHFLLETSKRDLLELNDTRKRGVKK